MWDENSFRYGEGNVNKGVRSTNSKSRLEGGLFLLAVQLVLERETRLKKAIFKHVIA